MNYIAFGTGIRADTPINQQLTIAAPPPSSPPMSGVLMSGVLATTSNPTAGSAHSNSGRTAATITTNAPETSSNASDNQLFAAA